MTSDQRRQLAAAYRLSDEMGWSELIYNHISLRTESNHFLINPFGVLHSEMTPENLLTVNLRGDIIDQGDTSFPVNQPGFVLHSAIHAARDDVACVMHIHSAEGVAVSTMKCGLLPISQQAVQLGKIAYHDYEGITIDEEEIPRLIRDLGDAQQMILRNHGLVTVGKTVGEAFFRMFLLHTACKSQLLAMSAVQGDLSMLNLVSSEIAEKTETIQKTINVEGFGEREFRALVRRFVSRGGFN